MRWLALCALLCVSPAHAQAPAAPPSANAKLPRVEPTNLHAGVQPERVLVGEPFVYEIVLTHPSDQRYELDLPPELGDFELLSQARTPPQAGAEPAITTFQLRMSAFQLGLVTLPDVPFLVTTPEGPKRYVLTGRTLEVGSVLPPEAESKGEDLRDIRPPDEVAIRSWTLVYGVLGALAAALVGMGVWRLLQKYRARVAAAVAPPEPLNVRTRRSLQRLEAEGLPAKGRSQEFYFRLSEILRGYLGERYEFDALECTSSELMSQLRRLKPARLPEDGLMRFISESDMVKYARAEASAESCQAALAFGYELLDKTWLLSPPAEAAPESHVPGPRVVP